MSATSVHMQQALDRSRLARGVSPNPSVGCVIVRDGAVVGSGFTSPPGGHHAEAAALLDAGAAARGAEVYVTLEPCSHYGRTPPCADALIDAGVAAVHCALRDPDARVHGRGIAKLRGAGVRVTLGDGEAEAKRLLAAYLTHRQTGVPLVTVKFAASLDGKIATRTGDARWISGPDARAATRLARAEIDAILVGSGTVLADDPHLTARHADGAFASRQPLRVVLDRVGRIPPSARVLDEAARTLVFTTAAASPAWTAAVEGRGARVVVAAQPLRPATETTPAPITSAEFLGDVLRELGRRRVLSLLVEGGGTVHGAFFDAGLVDRVQAIIASLVIGGADAPSAVGGLGAPTVRDAAHLHEREVLHLGDDLLISGWTARAAARLATPI